MTIKNILIVLVTFLLVGCDAIYVSAITPTNLPTQTVTLSPSATPKKQYTPTQECKIIDLYKNNLTTVNMHSGAGMEYPVIHIAKSNETYQVLGAKNNWIETNKGYIYYSWCK